MTRHGCSRERTWGLARFHPAMDDDFQLFSLTQQLIIRLGRILQGAEPVSRSFTGAGRAPAPGLGHQRDAAGLERCFESTWAPCAQHLGALGFLLLMTLEQGAGPGRLSSHGSLQTGRSGRGRQTQPRPKAEHLAKQPLITGGGAQRHGQGRSCPGCGDAEPWGHPGMLSTWLCHAHC